MAHLHGRPWLPWQHLAADLIGERTPQGRYAYPVVVITVPRQCGKTTLVLDLALGRGLQTPDYRAAYAAQTGHKTTTRFGDRFTEIEASVLAGRVRLRRSMGTERLTLTATGSYVKAYPPIAGALRSDALDLVIVDEAQEHDELLGEALDAMILPTFTTRPRRQLILIGTAGTDRSAYLRRYLDAAREGRPGYALLEWGAADGDDLEAPETWQARHPGLGPLTDLEALTSARAVMGPAGFAREYLNVWSRTDTRVIDPALWAAAQLPADIPRPTDTNVCFGVDVTADRAAAAVSVACPMGDGRTYVEVVALEAGTGWVVPRLLELQATYGAPIAADKIGAVGTVTDALELAGANLLPMRANDVANAAAGFVDDLTAGRLAVYPNPAFDEAIAGAAKRPLGDDNGFGWSRRTSAVPVAPLVASCAARWGLERLPPNIKPEVHAL